MMQLWLWVILGLIALIIIGWIIEKIQKRKKKIDISKAEKEINNNQSKNHTQGNMHDTNKFL